MLWGAHRFEIERTELAQELTVPAGCDGLNSFRMEVQAAFKGMNGISGTTTRFPEKRAMEWK